MNFLNIFNVLENRFQEFIINQNYQSHELSSLFYEEVFKTNLDFRAVVLREGFKDLDEEISFFKYVKPRIIGMSKALNKIIKIELKIKSLDDILINEIVQVEITKTEKSIIKKSKLLDCMFKDHNYDLYHFTRVKSSLDCIDKINEFGYHSLNDDSLSKFWYKLYLIKYLFERIENLTNQVYTIQNSKNRNKLKWTHTKSGFVELVYALVASGAINDGKVTFTEVYEHILNFLEIDSDIKIHQVINDIKKRKKDVTKFIDELNLSLQNYINQ